MNNSTDGQRAAFLLFLTFLILRLIHQIDWSWWRVSAPLWGFVALLVAAELAIGIGQAIAEAVDEASYRLARRRATKEASAR